MQRQARDRRHAVIALLAVHLDMIVAERLQGLGRKLVVRALGFLQAEDVRLPGLQQMLDQRHAQANGVDVPSGDGKGHASFPDRLGPDAREGKAGSGWMFDPSFKQVRRAGTRNA
ncbi:hypothetical protein D3C71_1846850 [compost metagenome]